MDTEERRPLSDTVDKGVHKVNIGLYMCAFREPHLIQPSIRQWLPFKFHRFIVAASEKPWYGGMEKDNTADLARETGVEVIEKYWKTEAAQRNECMELLKDCDWIIHWFPDHFLTREDRVKMFEFLYTNPTEKIYSLDGYTYWKNFHSIIEPRPKVKAVTTSDIRFDWAFHAIGEGYTYPTLPMMLHHLQWSKTANDIHAKISSYHHAHEIDPNWFENVWKKDGQPHDFHPISPTAFTTTVEHALPQEIIDLLNPQWVQEVENG